MSMNDLGVTDFQLHVLCVMRAPEELTERTLGILGADSVTMAERSDLVAKCFIIRPGAAAQVRGILAGATIVENGPDEAGQSDVVRYLFPAWPEWEFKVTYDPSGMAVYSSEFVRPQGAELSTPVELVPWRFLKGDMPGPFEDIDEVDLWDVYESYTATDRSSRRRWFLRFAWGLLQEISPME
jgi:hypothetical protein